MAKWTEQSFFKRKSQMANKHMKKCLLPGHKEMQVKTTQDSTSPLLE
jgi:hypothetical protein